MSHYPPRGKEKQVLLKIKKMIDPLRELGNKVDWINTPTISLGHAIEGVRVNGHKKVIGLLDVHREYCNQENDFQEQVRIINLYAEKAAEVREEIESLVGDNFMECPICHGEKGTEERNQKDICKRYEWKDCKRCEGRGIVSLYRRRRG